MKEQDDMITAKTLCDAFIENKAKAEREYGNRVMKISGYAVHVGPDMFGLPCVELSKNKKSEGRTICLLPFTDYLKLRNLSKGDEVVMEGEVRTINDRSQKVVVKNCRLVELKNKNMKKAIILLCTIAVFVVCNNTSAQQQANGSINSTKITDMNVKDKSFDELFIKVDSAEIMPTLTKLILEEANTVITAGGASQYNSQMANWQVLSNYFMRPIPTTLCLLGSSRYTLEFIRQEQSYTMSFFPDEYKGEAMKFGLKSGRNSDKMKETKLTHVLTPSGNSTYKEANVIIESRLFEITTVNPDDFYTEDGKKFVVDGAKDNNGEYHKLVLGRITNVWVRK